MPQLRLEYSANIIEKNNMASLFQECHSILEKMLPADINACKSRAIECSNYYVGNGHPENAFVHLSLAVLPGRKTETLKNTGEMIHGILKSHFSQSFKKLNLQITLEVRELGLYFKS
jgi:5-carboxymethyl-2-hydroxymuconate isomerase